MKSSLIFLVALLLPLLASGRRLGETPSISPQDAVGDGLENSAGNRKLRRGRPPLTPKPGPYRPPPGSPEPPLGTNPTPPGNPPNPPNQFVGQRQRAPPTEEDFLPYRRPTTVHMVGRRHLLHTLLRVILSVRIYRFASFRPMPTTMKRKIRTVLCSNNKPPMRETHNNYTTSTLIPTSRRTPLLSLMETREPSKSQLPLQQQLRKLLALQALKLTPAPVLLSSTM